MATANTTSSISDLSDQVNAIAAQLAGTEATLRMFKDSDECGGELGDAIALLAISVGRMNDELCTIAGQMTEGGAA
jgi:hypothetical protein